MSAELEHHLEECELCRNEYLAELELDKTVAELPVFKAPDGVFDRIMKELDDTAEKQEDVTVIEKPRSFFAGMLPQSLPLVPAAAGFAAALVAAVWITFFLTSSFHPGMGKMIAEERVPELEDAEVAYLKAIDKYMTKIDASKDQLDPELYDIYREKLAILDEYILECKEAIGENEFNGNARHYLAMAYMEKAQTLKEMALTIQG